MQPSLGDVHGTVSTSHLGLWRRIFAFGGPAYLVSVGYMDPGNWATDLLGGSSFGYRLLWVLVASNAIAILLQTLSARLGIVAGRDLAQACRETYPRPVNFALWIFCEIAIIACDLAEVLGAAVALNLLFHLPMLIGVLITAFDTLLLLALQRLGIRAIEAVILSLISIIAICFAIEVFWSQPELGTLAAGLIPHLDNATLYVTISMLGATVMPHNFYLHSALVQTRNIEKSEDGYRRACRYNLIDSTVALCGAMLVNCAILIVAAATFFRHHQEVSDLRQAYVLLTPLLGTAASGVFAIALLASGQSSTLTGTMAGQIVMEGFLNIRVRPWLRRLVTRALAILPAAVVIHMAGEEGVGQLIILSQVVLSMNLPFAIIPLIHFTSNPERMGVFVNKPWIKASAWGCTAAVVAANAWLVQQSIEDWTKGAPTYATPIWIVSAAVVSAVGLLLLWITFEPAIRRRAVPAGASSDLVRPPQAAPFEMMQYKRILVPLDHSTLDREALAHAGALAKAQGARLFLLHVEEGVTSQVYGQLSETAEVEAGREYLDEVVESLRHFDLDVETAIRHSSDPRREIVRYAREIQADLLVMGAHGHGVLKDLIFGDTINPVRHALKIPILVVRAAK
jgi:manganese transport protein